MKRSLSKLSAKSQHWQQMDGQTEAKEGASDLEIQTGEHYAII